LNGKMVRVNIINPKNLSDQHLIAEYNEILMLIGHVRKFPKIYEIPKDYCLGKGHIKFFKNKLLYLKKRHEKIKAEMRNRRFKTDKTIKLDFKKELLNDWKPKKEDFACIKKRIKEKLKKKPGYYRYYRKKRKPDFFIRLIDF